MLRNRKLAVALVAISMLLGGVGVAAASQTTTAAPITYKAVMTGAEQVPPVTTNATGTALFQVVANRKALKYTITLKNVKGLTETHIHQGFKGQNGDVVMVFTAMPPPGFTAPTITLQGFVTAANLTGPMQGERLDALLMLMNNKAVYMNVHTATVDGLIRGQIGRG